jgi:hypothetical protein
MLAQPGPNSLASLSNSKTLSLAQNRAAAGSTSRAAPLQGIEANLKTFLSEPAQNAPQEFIKPRRFSNRLPRL